MPKRNKPSYAELESRLTAFCLCAGNACGGLNRAIELLESINDMDPYAMLGLRTHLKFLRRINCQAQREIAATIGRPLDDVLNGGNCQ
jgi:hypothetical protein